MGHIRGSRNFWEDSEVIYLKENYILKGNAELSVILGRSPGAVQNKAQKLGIPLKGHRNSEVGSRAWTVDEKIILKQMAGKYAVREIAGTLKRTFCSVYHQMQKMKLRGWQKPKGRRRRLRDYNKWSWLSNKVRARDGHGCRVCGYKKHTIVHHITPLYEGGSDDEGNLITLCPNCHAEAHANEIKL